MAYDGHGAAPCGQPILQVKELAVDWGRYKAWLNALHEPYEDWLIRTKAYDPTQREW